MAIRGGLREHLYITLLRKPTGCLTFQQFIDRLHVEPAWTNISPFDLCIALRELLHERQPRIEWREDGRYCRRVLVA
jgi:hypothetical protein